ncbi:cytochrome b5 [Clavulina sp. PMI_390]|nr:cytochrome b5 [Clavulina sp. PMI_390]
MSLNADEDGVVNPPPPLASQKINTKKVRDARGNMVTDKGANGAFLAYREYQVKKEAAEKAKAEKMKRRAEKLAKGIPLDPEDELEKEGSIGVALIRTLFILTLVGLVLGWFITGSALWGYDGKWVQMNTYFPPPSLLLSEEELALFDGTSPDKPVYIGIDGHIYDVSAGRANYGPGGRYHNFAGIDAARAFATACTNGDRTHDLRGLTEAQMKSLEKWKKYYDNRPKYPRVGRVYHPAIKPRDPMPPPCGEEPTRAGAAPVPVDNVDKKPPREDL